VLSERGLAAALQGVAQRAPLPVEIEDVPDQRLPESVEVAAYHLISEALANVAKYAHASAATITVRRSDDRVIVEVTDDGIGGADLTRGSGLRGLADRIGALGGRVVVNSPPSDDPVWALDPLGGALGARCAIGVLVSAPPKRVMGSSY
jgi:signal transduction histidine kinase